MIKNNSNFEDKSNDLSRKKQGKRRLANREATILDLKKYLPILNSIFEKCLLKVNISLSVFQPIHRSRTLQANLMQTALAEELSIHFGSKFRVGKYKRLILQLGDYILLFKSLNSKNMPMNIKTNNVQCILHQNASLDLFSESSELDSPIIFFGYKKNALGKYIEPQLVYIDDSKVEFTIALDIYAETYENNPVEVVNNETVVPVLPKLKGVNQVRKVN